MKLDLRLLHQHFHIFPIEGSGDKAPLIIRDKNGVEQLKENGEPKRYWWKKVHKKKESFELLSQHESFGVACGLDGLEVVDIDNHFNDADKLFEFVDTNFDLSTFPVIKTQGGGYHIYYKCSIIGGNRKLAARRNKKGKSETLIETRGKGGYVAGPPTKGYEVISGDILKVPKISPEDREILLSICRSLNEIAEKEKEETKNQKANSEYSGNIYNNDSGSVFETCELLRKHGWQSGDNRYWIRPGKDKGISATFCVVGKNKFYCFSTNADPFESQSSYTMFGVRSMLIHDGDYKKCAKELGARYGHHQGSAPEEKKKKRNKWTILQEIIDKWKLKFRYNELTKVMSCSAQGGEYGKIDLLIGDIVREMEVNKGVTNISSNKLKEMISNTTTCEVYNQIKQFEKNMPKWDGRDLIDDMCGFIELQVDEDRSYFVSMMKKHMIRTVRCAIEKKYINRMVLVFYGAQEIGKSKFFEWLTPDGLYNAEPIDTMDKDSILALSRFLIVNMDELDSLNKKDVSKLKAFISRSNVIKRVPYGKYDEEFARVASFVGTANKTDLLVDESNTRWLIVKVQSFDWRKYTASFDPMQLWAQAYALYKKDPDSGELTKEERAIREQRNNKIFLETTSEREVLMKYYSEGEEEMTATEIKIEIEKELFPLKINFYQLGRELRRCYGEPKRKSDGRFYSLRSSWDKKRNYEVKSHFESKTTHLF